MVPPAEEILTGNKESATDLGFKDQAELSGIGDGRDGLEFFFELVEGRLVDRTDSAMLGSVGLPAVEESFVGDSGLNHRIHRRSAVLEEIDAMEDLLDQVVTQIQEVLCLDDGDDSWWAAVERRVQNMRRG